MDFKFPFINYSVKNTDYEAKLFMWFLRLKEEQKKEYSDEEDGNKVYIFENYSEFSQYFENYGITDRSLMEICRMKTTKKGTVLALKSLCDYAIAIDNSLKGINPKERNLCLKK